MQLLSPSLSGSGSSVLHKTALFSDTSDRDHLGAVGASVSLVEPPAPKRREPLTQRLRREFGLLATNNDEMDLATGTASTSVMVPVGGPAAYTGHPAASSFPTATVQTPNGPQQVFYVPQPATGQALCPAMAGKQPVALSPLSVGGGGANAAARTFKTTGSLSSAQNRASSGSAGAGYKPGYY